MDVTAIKCPDWVKPALTRILDLEIGLGNIIADENWQTADADKLSAKIGGLTEQDDYDDSVVENLFKKVCKALRDAGHSPETTAAFINAHIKTGSKLKYCDENEVLEALA